MSLQYARLNPDAQKNATATAPLKLNNGTPYWSAKSQSEAFRRPQQSMRQRNLMS
jgi:hypothetical protein